MLFSTKPTPAAKLAYTAVRAVMAYRDGAVLALIADAMMKEDERNSSSMDLYFAREGGNLTMYAADGPRHSQGLETLFDDMANADPEALLVHIFMEGIMASNGTYLRALQQVLSSDIIPVTIQMVRRSLDNVVLSVDWSMGLASDQAKQERAPNA